MSVMTISDMDEHENEQYSTDFGARGFLVVCSVENGGISNEKAMYLINPR